MKDYVKYSVKDFIMDDYFQSWVFHPDESKNTFWLLWISNNPSKVETLEEARRVLQSARFKNYQLPEHEVTSLWLRINTENKVSKEKNKNSSKSYFWYKIAASLTLISAIAFIFFYNNTQQIVYSTNFGETKTITLPDSSTVILNSNSSITLSSAWNVEPPREVWLKGEGFFSVTHKKNNQPFRVHTRGFAIEVLGTTFNVYDRSANTRIVLNSGKIQLKLPLDRSKDLIMAPGEMVEYKDNLITKKKVDPLIYSAWTQRKIILNHTSLNEMIKLVKDNYNLTVNVSKEDFLSQTVSGSIPITNAESLVHHIAKVFRLKLTRVENEYYLYE